MNSKSSLLASPRAAGAATVTRTSSALTPGKKYELYESRPSTSINLEIRFQA